MDPTDPLSAPYNRACAAIAKLSEEAHRLANEHAFAVDLLRAQVESLRAINAGLRERIEVLDHRCAHTAEVLAMPVDTEGPRGIVMSIACGLTIMKADHTTRRAEHVRVNHPHGWTPYPGVWLTEAQARLWVLDGVLP